MIICTIVANIIKKHPVFTKDKFRKCLIIAVNTTGCFFSIQILQKEGEFIEILRQQYCMFARWKNCLYFGGR